MSRRFKIKSRSLVMLIFWLSTWSTTLCQAEQFREHCMYDWTWKQSRGREFGVQIGYLVDLYSDSPTREFPIEVDILWGTGSWYTTLNQLIGFIVLLCLGAFVSFLIVRRTRFAGHPLT